MRRLTADRLESLDNPTVLGKSAPLSRDAQTSAPDPAEALRIRQTQVLDDARKQGHAQGMTDAEREIAQRVEKIETRLRVEHDAAVARLEAGEERLRKFISSLQGALDGHAESAETLAVEVAYASVVRLLGEKSADRSLMLDLCRAVIREYGHPPATLRVSEADLGLLETSQLDIPVEVDRRLVAGQCVIDTARGQFETGLDIRLAALSKALLDTVGEHRGQT
jgi:flagellar biosynthesis/type III secretory pathway protein FliH